MSGPNWLAEVLGLEPEPAPAVEPDPAERPSLRPNPSQGRAVPRPADDPADLFTDHMRALFGTTRPASLGD